MWKKLTVLFNNQSTTNSNTAEDYLALEKQGQSLKFVPNRQQALDQEVGFKPGDPVQIRFSNIAYQGKLLRKAGVSAAPKISASEVA